MKSIDIVSKIVAREGEAKASPSKGIQSINLSDYLLKSVWDKVFEIRTDSQGTEYIFGKLPVVTQSGITMYSGDGVDVPSLASGLPFDGRTIWYNPDTQQIEVIGGTGGGSGEGVSNFWDLSGIPSWITNSKPKYTYSEIEGTPDLTQYALVSQIPSLSGYATESWVTQQNYATKATTLSGYGITDAYTKTNVDDLLKAYVTLSGSQTITGEKNFTGGLKVNGSPIYYDTEKKYWKLEGDLLVTGGVTMYGSDSSFTPSTIMDALLYDDTTLGINSNGQLYVKGGTSGGGLDITALQNYLTQNSYLNVTEGDGRYLKLSGGTVSGDLFVSNSYGGLILSNTSKGHNGFLIYNGNSEWIVTDDGWNKAFRVLHEGNYSSYALPLSGGEISGTLTISPTNISGFQSGLILKDNGYGGNEALKIVWTSTNYTNENWLAANPSTSELLFNNYYVWHSGNFTPSNYLPLSGGTITSASPVSVTLNANNDGQTALFLQSKGTNKTYVGWDINRGTCLYDFSSDSHFGILNGIPRFNSNTIWHSGNDGDGSGLEADTIGTYKKDSGEKTIIYGTRSDNSNIRRIYDNGWNLMCQNGSDNGVIATLNSNVASATKLQTARTIWGQSFDGTGNVSGNLTLENNYEIVTKNTSGSISSTLYRTKSNNLSIGEGIAKESNDTYISGYNLFLRYGTGLTNGISLISSGNVGIGMISPSYTLDVSGTCRASISVTSNMFFTNGEYGIWKGSSFTGGLSANDLAYYAEKNVFYGNVGIGTTTLDWGKLHVYSNDSVWAGRFRTDKTQVALANPDGGGLAIDSTCSNTEFALLNIRYGQTDLGGGGNVAMTVMDNGNVGVGIANPMQRLHINGILRVQRYGDSNSYIDIQSNDISVNYKGYDKSDGYCYHAFYSNDTELVRFSGVDNIATFQGNIVARGGITMYSMRALKNVVDERGLSLSELSTIKPTRYTWKDGRDNRLHFGGIADDIQQVLPEVVYSTSDGILTMDYGNAAFAVASSLIQPVVDHEKRIAMLEAENKQLRKEVERLKSA